MNDEKILSRIEASDNAQNSEFFGRDVIVVFARAPVPGQVKTRLAKTLGDDKAAELYAAMLRDCLNLAKRAAHKEGNCSVVLCHWPPDAFEVGKYSLQPFWRGARLAQSEGDLGEKLWHCLEHFRKLGAKRVIVIGSDSPDLPSVCINRAFHLLTKKKLDFSHGKKQIVQRRLVLGPARDGGFYLLAVQGGIPRELFTNVDWSTPNTRRHMEANADALHIFHDGTPLWKGEDVDTPGDLSRLITRLNDEMRHPGLNHLHTARWLRLENRL